MCCDFQLSLQPWSIPMSRFLCPLAIAETHKSVSWRTRTYTPGTRVETSRMGLLSWWLHPRYLKSCLGWNEESFHCLSDFLKHFAVLLGNVAWG
jgi:hypothetical protein